MKYMKQLAYGALVTAMLTAGVGCSRHVSRDISPDGQAGEVVFPSIERLVLKDGTHTTTDRLAQIGPGMTKDQLYDLLGRPHFREGFRAREWDYLLHFRKADGAVRTCQYKVVFDENYKAKSFHWMPAECAEVGRAAEQVKPVVAEPMQPAQSMQLAAGKVRRFDLSGDALFSLGRYSVDDMQEGGQEQVDKIARELSSSKSAMVQVVGHTDYLGSEQGNLLLSRRRAETVRSILLAGGVPSNSVLAVGKGEAEPIKQCDASMPRAQLVNCLQPNRRVEIVAVGLE